MSKFLFQLARFQVWRWDLKADFGEKKKTGVGRSVIKEKAILNCLSPSSTPFRSESFRDMFQCGAFKFDNFFQGWEAEINLFLFIQRSWSVLMLRRNRDRRNWRFTSGYIWLRNVSLTAIAKRGRMKTLSNLRTFWAKLLVPNFKVLLRNNSIESPNAMFLHMFVKRRSWRPWFCIGDWAVWDRARERTFSEVSWIWICRQWR